MNDDYVTVKTAEGKPCGNNPFAFQTNRPQNEGQCLTLIALVSRARSREFHKKKCFSPECLCSSKNSFE